MSKNSYTSAYVRKVAPVYNKVLGYTTKKVRDTSLTALFKELRLVRPDVAKLQPNKPVRILGDYTWKDYCMVGDFPAAILHYQLSLYLQRARFLGKFAMNAKAKRELIDVNPPVLIMSVPFPVPEELVYVDVDYLRGVCIAPNADPVYVFAPCYPYIHGNQKHISGRVEEVSSILQLAPHALLRRVFSMAKYLVALPPAENRCHVDLMTIPRAYDVEKDDLAVFPPQLKARLRRSTFMTPGNRFYTKAPFYDFDGLGKYTTHPQKPNKGPENFESLLQLVYPGNEKNQTPESLSQFMVSSFRARNECHIYGIKNNKRLDRISRMNYEIKEHARLELLTFEKARKSIKESNFSRRSLDPPAKITPVLVKTKKLDP